MTDMKKVIKGLEETEIMLMQAINRDDGMAVMRVCGCLKRVSDSIAMLKEQEAVSVDNGKCPSCNWDFENGELDFSNINESQFYCPRCGQAVKFDD